MMGMNVNLEQPIYTRRSPIRERSTDFEIRNNQSTYMPNYISPAQEEFETKFWRVIKEAK